MHFTKAQMGYIKVSFNRIRNSANPLKRLINGLYGIWFATVFSCMSLATLGIIIVIPGQQRWIRGNHATVAVRITDHPLLSYLCERLQSPLVSTSANHAGKSTVRSALQLRRQFSHQLDFIVTGFNTGDARPSDIKSLASGMLLRTAR